MKTVKDLPSYVNGINIKTKLTTNKLKDVKIQAPNTAAVRFKERNVFVHSNTGIMSSNPIRAVLRWANPQSKDSYKLSVRFAVLD
jgi:hypothetical protein